MINMTTLRSILKQIYGVEDKYLIPLNESWFVPTIDEDDKTGTWIGYKILSKVRYARAGQSNGYMCVEERITFRLTFVGANAEELADQTMLWEDRGDVTDAFTDLGNAEINYDNRVLYTYPVRNKGLNDKLAWIVDMKCQTVYTEDMKHKGWFPKETQQSSWLNN